MEKACRSVWRRFGGRSLAARPNGRRALWRESQAARTGRARRLRAQTKDSRSHQRQRARPAFLRPGLDREPGLLLITAREERGRRVTNKLHFGDNLHVLREHIGDASVDLSYLDPPFNSNANHNILFKSPEGAESDVQIEAFEDTWHWNDSAEAAFDAVMQSGNSNASELLGVVLNGAVR
jgi:hypothetical protein